MPRGGPSYAKLNCKVWHGERIRQLSTGEQLTYFYLWTAAVECRSSTIPPELASPGAVAEGMHRRPQSVKKWLDMLCGKLPSESNADNESVDESVYGSVYGSVDASVKEKMAKASYTPRRKRQTEPLVTRHPDGSITVHEVKEIHAGLKWDKEYTPTPQTGKDDSPDGENAFPNMGPYPERGEGKRGAPNNSSNTKTSSAFDHQTDEIPEVSPSGEQKRSPLDASSKKDTPTGPDSIASLAEMKAARPSGPEEIHALAFEVIDSLSLPDESHIETEDIVAGYPVVWTRDCILTTRDKQQRISEGTDTEGFREGPLQYLAGSLLRKYEALKNNLR